jgi:hypothetical protein
VSARPDDARSVEAIVPALYACISGPAGAPRDWERLRSLARPDARFLRSVTDPDGRVRGESFCVDGYIADVAPFLATHDFHEVQLDLRVERSGHVAHAWSRYEARPRPDSPVVLRRGLNSIQLWHDGARWWIVSAAWDTAAG